MTAHTTSKEVVCDSMGNRRRRMGLSRKNMGEGIPQKIRYSLTLIT